MCPKIRYHSDGSKEFRSLTIKTKVSQLKSENVAESKQVEPLLWEHRFAPAPAKRLGFSERLHPRKYLHVEVG